MKTGMRCMVAGARLMCLAISGLALLLAAPAGVLAEEHGGGGGGAGGGGGGGCGNIFGDLIHILRDADTGQPILQKRLVELPGDVLDFDYCPIPIDINGDEIPFAQESCDPDPLYIEAVVEVDYFGRLNGGRTKERNNRMHFNEVISSIKNADIVTQDETGRLMFGYDCGGNSNCGSWSTIDSPMESLALYTRLMKYGHFQTDPLEVDLWAHGDPALGIQYHPSLDASDWAKFQTPLSHLAPADVGNYWPEELDKKDFALAGIFLGAAANKTGKITVDLVQYLNRILKITQDTATTSSNPLTLPALIRDGENNIYPANDEFEERFVDFGAMQYDRAEWHDEDLSVIRPMKNIRPKKKGSWDVDDDVSLLGWLEFINGESQKEPIAGIEGFVAAGSDALRAIEFVHNYRIPADLGWSFK
ncbi:MAG: hypothetical protein C0619_03540 [Desulfuromonas sp.]|nr:MAG: hypothetical protein C0619_03540 [Desulfuromonas sp.]